MKIGVWLKGIVTTMRRYPLHTVLFMAALAACYFYVCNYFAMIIGVYALVWAAKRKPSPL